MDGVQLTSTLQSYYEEISIVLIAFKMQLTWIKPASRLTLPNLAGSFKKSKNPGFSWVSPTCRAGHYMGSRTQLSHRLPGFRNPDYDTIALSYPPIVIDDSS